MSAAAAEAAVGAPSRVRGRTTVAPRALNRTVTAVVAEVFGVAPRSVQVAVSDRGGLLALHVRTPIRGVSLERVKRAPALVDLSGTLLQQAAAGQRLIRERVAALTGAAVAHVTVQVTAIETRQERRVE